MEKTLFKKQRKNGEFSIIYLPNTFVIGFVGNDVDYRYICLGPFMFEWLKYIKKKK